MPESSKVSRGFGGARARLLPASLFVMLASGTAFAGDDSWRPVSPDDLSANQSTVEKDADAEVLFKDVYIDLGFSKVTKSTYVRIKIFNERGAKAQGTVELPYLNKEKVEQIAARTIKRDGTIVELKPAAIFDREIVKIRGFKVKVKSFALPAVEPGAIIEYRWRESEKLFDSLRLDLQDDIPARFVTYTLKVSADLDPFIRFKTFNGPEIGFVHQEKNLRVAKLKDILASREEPYMPPKSQVRSWMLIYFADWSFSSRYLEAMLKHLSSILKPSGELNKAAVEIIGDATTPDQKLCRLFRFCTSNIRNVSQSDPGSEGAEVTFKENKTPTDTLKQGIGTGSDINFLFAALAQAAGFNPYLAQLPDRSDIFFDPTSHDIALSVHFLSATHIAIKVDGEWRFFDPASKYVPYGMLRWQEETGRALLYGAVGTAQAQTPLTPPEKSLIKRTARLKLGDDGALEGEVRVECTGHPATEERLDYASGSVDEYVESLKKTVTERLTGAEVSDVRTENAADTTLPFVYSYRIRAPGYAQRTGKRLFVQPAFFQHGRAASFSASHRKYPVYFHYPWSESDSVVIDLPAGYVPDSPDQPEPLTAGKLSQYKGEVRISDGGRLQYERSFYFGGGGVIVFPPTSYSLLKQFFDDLHERDNRIITLKQE